MYRSEFDDSANSASFGGNSLTQFRRITLCGVFSITPLEGAERQRRSGVAKSSSVAGLAVNQRQKRLLYLSKGSFAPRSLTTADWHAVMSLLIDLNTCTIKAYLTLLLLLHIFPLRVGPCDMGLAHHLFGGRSQASLL